MFANDLPPAVHPEASEGPGCCTHCMYDRFIIKNQFAFSFVPLRLCGETCRVSKEQNIQVPRRPQDDIDLGAAVILRPPKDLAVQPFDEVFANIG